MGWPKMHSVNIRDGQHISGTFLYDILHHVKSVDLMSGRTSLANGRYLGAVAIPECEPNRSEKWETPSFS